MLELGQKGPDFELPGVDENTVSLNELLQENQAVAVIFTCNHCPYAQAWEDRIVAIQNDYRDRGVAIVAINPNDAVKYPDDDFGHMKQRAQARGFNFPYLRDESQDVAHAYGATRTPHVFLLDGMGVLRYRGAIDDNYENPGAVEQPYLRRALDAVLAGNPVPDGVTEEVGCTIKWK